MMGERVLAIDYGERRVGLAISDPDTGFVSGLPTLDRKALKEGGLTAAIATLVAERGIQRILLGMPYSLDGTMGPAAQRVLAFRDRLYLALDVPVEEWDERLTTREAEVLFWVARGKTNDEIATVLGIGLTTVKKHLESTYAKLGVENRTTAAAMALEHMG